MEILELLLAGPEFCGCMVEILAAVLDLSAVVSGVRTGKKLKDHREAKALGEAPLKKPKVWPLVALVLGAMFFTGLAIFRWSRPVP